MLRVLFVPIFILLLHVTALTAAAIPSCPVGATIAVYLALGADGSSPMPLLGYCDKRGAWLCLIRFWSGGVGGKCLRSLNAPEKDR